MTYSSLKCPREVTASLDLTSSGLGLEPKVQPRQQQHTQDIKQMGFGVRACFQCADRMSSPEFKTKAIKLASPQKWKR